MKASDRRDVLWIGGSPPKQLQEQVQVHNLRLCLTTEAKSIDLAPSSRAVVIEFNGDEPRFLGTARRCITRLLDHGLLIILCHRNHTRAEAIKFQHLESSLLNGNRHRNIFAAYQRWEEIAFRASTHQPGPGENSKLKLYGVDLSEIEKLFLRRAFFDNVELRCASPNTAGLSGARVLIVHPKKNGGPDDCELPKIVKVGSVDEIELESNVFSDFVRDTVPFNYRPNMIWERKVIGREHAAIVQDFVDRALPFETAVKNGNASVVSASLFDGALGNWRSAASAISDGQLYGHIVDLIARGMNGSESDLHKAMQMAKISTWPTNVNLASVVYHRCRIHRDLHAGNVFVGATSGDCILIDFQKATLGPAAFDPAALEVQLVFRSQPHWSVLKKLYSFPLELPPLSPDWLMNAVRAVRIFGAGTETSPAAYSLAVIFQLIRYAKFAQPPLQYRARALRLAHKMLKHVAP
jgi:hypothetical protein